MKEAYLYLNKLLKDNDKIVIATSGGPDSMALLYLTMQVKKNIKIICTHVNHNTGRVGQNEEQEYVKNFCKKNNIIFETMKIENYSDDNFENEARNKRYEYFDKIIKKYEAKYLLTAHHGDDLMETILMRIVRGSSLKGYAGFMKETQKKNYKVIRPLIEVTKDDILKYNEQNQIKYFIDKTNYDENYTRNRYRKNILPKLKEEDKNVHLKFYKFSKILNEYNNYIDKEVENKLKKIYVDNTLDLDLLKKEEKIIALKIINIILENIYQENLFLITDIHSLMIYELAFNKKANTKINLPNNLIVSKNYNKLKFIKEEEQKDDYEVEIIDYVKLPNNHQINVIESIDSDSNYICRLSKKDVLFPLHVRNRKDGDKMEIKGLNGTKKINDIFINSKIVMEERNKWPIVVDSKGTIVWLPGLKKSKFDKTKYEKYDIILKYQ